DLISNKFVDKKVTAIYKDTKDNYWIGTLMDGLFRYDEKNKRFTNYIHKPSNPGSICSNHINAVLEDKSGRLWLGTAGGLCRFNETEGTFTGCKISPGINDELTQVFVISVYQGNSGKVWIGSKAGLSLFNPETGTFANWQHIAGDSASLTNSSVSATWEDDAGILWICTWGGGLNRFDPVKGTFTHYLEKHGLAGSFVYSIVGDENGNLWISSNRGLSRFNPRTETFKNYEV
ncbi:MAG: histidine kinase, partial [bacterium]|nr:histidine kinase [bacterium]